ncbi:hypothetical protein ACWEIJ_42885 [Lentzea sp. NPDC004789]
MIRLAGDDRSGVSTQDWEVEEPSLERIEQAIANLDGLRWTEVSVTAEDPFRYISVGGGPELFLVTGELSDGTIIQLHDESKNLSAEVELVCGGQMGVFKRSDLVGRLQAINAVSEFLQDFSGGLGPAWSME